jgi:hypothetical protein
MSKKPDPSLGGHRVVMRVPLHDVDYIPDGRYRLLRAPPKCGELSDELFDEIEGEGMSLHNRFHEVYFVPDGSSVGDGFFFVSPKELTRIESAQRKA